MQLLKRRKNELKDLAFKAYCTIISCFSKQKMCKRCFWFKCKAKREIKIVRKIDR